MDEDTKAKILLNLLGQAGHDVVSTQDLGTNSALDAEVFDLAQIHGRVVPVSGARQESYSVRRFVE